MPRKPRLHVPDAFYHVILRGNAQQPIFFAERDREVLDQLIGEGVQRFGHRIHAYCWMPNHLHLAIQVAEVPLAGIVQNFAFRYARWINTRRRTSGHLFQGRYKALLVDAEHYLLELVRYIHLNPVRARLVHDPLEYRWSGHAAYLGQRPCPWLVTAPVLGLFHARLSEARQRYQRFVYQGMDQEAPPLSVGAHADERVLGDSSFCLNVTQQTPPRPPPPLEQLIALVCARLDVAPAALCAPGRDRHGARARAAVVHLAQQTSAASLSALAHHFGRDPSTLAKSCAHYRKHAPALFAQLLQAVENQ